MDLPTLTIAQTEFFSVLYRDLPAEVGGYTTSTVAYRSRLSFASQLNTESKVESWHDAKIVLLNTSLGAFVLYDPTSPSYASPMALPPLVRPRRFWRDAR